MKSALAALAFVVVGTLVAGPAVAFDGWERDSVVRDRGGFDRERDRGDWRRERWEDRDERLSETEIARRLMRRGFVRIEDIELRRDRYIVRAVRPNGALIRLAVDAYDGDIVARERIGWVADERGYGRRNAAPVSGIEFDLGGGTLGIYSR